MRAISARRRPVTSTTRSRPDGVRPNTTSRRSWRLCRRRTRRFRTSRSHIRVAVEVCTSSTEASSRSDCGRSEEHTSELQSRPHLVCRLLLEKKKKNKNPTSNKKKEKKNKNAE